MSWCGCLSCCEDSSVNVLVQGDTENQKIQKKEAKEVRITVAMPTLPLVNAANSISPTFASFRDSERSDRRKSARSEMMESIRRTAELLKCNKSQSPKSPSSTPSQNIAEEDGGHVGFTDNEGPFLPSCALQIIAEYYGAEKAAKDNVAFQWCSQNGRLPLSAFGRMLVSNTNALTIGQGNLNSQALLQLVSNCFEHIKELIVDIGSSDAQDLVLLSQMDRLQSLTVRTAVKISPEGLEKLLIKKVDSSCFPGFPNLEEFILQEVPTVSNSNGSKAEEKSEEKTEDSQGIKQRSETCFRVCAALQRIDYYGQNFPSKKPALMLSFRQRGSFVVQKQEQKVFAPAAKEEAEQQKKIRCYSVNSAFGSMFSRTPFGDEDGDEWVDDRAERDEIQ